MAQAAGLVLVIVTPAACALSLAMERLVARGAVRWVVDDGERAVEVATGQAVRWTEAGLEVIERPSGVALGDFPTLGWALHLEVETLYDSVRPPLGTLLETLLDELGLALPTAFGSTEPPRLRWSAEAVVEVARTRSPRPTEVTIAGAGYDGVLTIQPQPIGVSERLELHVDGGDEPLDRDRLLRLGRRLAEGGAQLTIGGYRPLAEGRLITAQGAPLLPALLVADTARFAGYEPRPGAADRVGTRAVTAYPAPAGLSSEDGRALLDRWAEDLRDLQEKDTFRDLDGRSGPVTTPRPS